MTQAAGLVAQADTATLRPVWEALSKEGKQTHGSEVAAGLLHFGTEIVACDQVRFHPHEHGKVRIDQEKAIDVLRQHGVDLNMVAIDPPSMQSLSKDCCQAATLMAEELELWHLNAVGNFEMTRPILPPEQERCEQTTVTLLKRGVPDEECAEAANAAMSAGLGLWASPTLMLACCESLRRRVRELAKNGCNDEGAARFLLFSRIALNTAIAHQHDRLYVPSVARAALLYGCWEHLLDRIASEAAGPLRTRPSPCVQNTLEGLHAPAIGTALLIACKGDPAGVIAEALRLRELAAPLRIALVPILKGLADPDSVNWQRSCRDLNRLASDLSKALHVANRGSPLLPRAVFGIGFPHGISVGCEVDLEAIRHLRQHPAMGFVTEVAKKLHHPVGRDRALLHKLAQNCTNPLRAA